MHGGVNVYRGTAAAVRNYLDADRSRADDYYLAEGTGIAWRFVTRPDGCVVELPSLTGDGYEAWIAGVDLETGQPRGRLRANASAVRFVEVVVNGPKSWSLAAELHPDVAAAYEAAQDRAAGQIIGWLAEHATTRVGPRGGQVAVPVERLEAVTVRHYTSRAGDPHRHVHLQVNARVFAPGSGAGWTRSPSVTRSRRSTASGTPRWPVIRNFVPGWPGMATPSMGRVRSSSLPRSSARSPNAPPRSPACWTGTKRNGELSIRDASPGRGCTGRGARGRGPRTDRTR